MDFNQNIGDTSVPQPQPVPPPQTPPTPIISTAQVVPPTTPPPLSSIPQTPFPAPTQVPPPIVSQPSIIQAPPSRSKKVPLIIGVLVILLLGGGGVYAYMNDIWPLAFPPYSKEDVLAKGILKLKDIKTASYTMSISFRGADREAGVTAFAYDKGKLEKDLESQKPAYERDEKRVGILKDFFYDIEYYAEDHEGVFPNTLYDYFLYAYPPCRGSYCPMNSYTENEELIDKSFSYTTSNQREKFEIAVTFETKAAIDAMKNEVRYMKDEEKKFIAIDSAKKTITIKSDALDASKYFSFYPYFSGTPQKPQTIQFLEGLDEALAFIPKDTALLGTFSGTGIFSGDTEGATSTRKGEASIAFSGKFDDATYEFGLDLKVAAETVYIRLNKFPGIPFLSAIFDLGQIKGKWIKITKEDIEQYSEEFLADAAGELFTTKDPWGDMTEIYKKLFSILQEEKVIVVSGDIQKESVGGKTVYGYPLSINREKLAPFYKRVVAEVGPLVKDKLKESDPLFTGTSLVEYDEDFVAYMESDDFKKLFDHLGKNTSFTAWFDKGGFPVRTTVDFRIVPIAEKPPLSERQYVFDIEYNLSDINKEISTEVPKETISLDEATELLTGQSLKDARAKANNAMIKSNLSSMRAQAELYYDGNKSFGPTFSEASCPFATSTVKNIFTDKNMNNSFQSIKKAWGIKLFNSRCAASSQSYAIAVELLPVDTVKENTYYCVDSLGFAKQFEKKVVADVIVGTGTKTSPYSCASK